MTSSILKFVYELVTGLLAEIGIIAFVMDTLREMIGNDILIFILVVGVTLTAIPARSLLHYREMKIQEGKIHISIAIAFSGVFYFFFYLTFFA